MTDVVPEAEEFGHDVPMDPTMEPEDSEHSEELDISEAPDSEGHVDDAVETEEAATSFNQNVDPLTSLPKVDEASKSNASTSASVATFDWDAYLHEQNAEPAPPECFFQPDTPAENKFQIGTKLMIADPRGPTGTSAMFCLGTVVNVYKLWLCIRLEGLDNSHEKWIFCDDESIQPIGPANRFKLLVIGLAAIHMCAGNYIPAHYAHDLPRIENPTTEDHMKLNPPIGFIHHHGTFPKFLEQHLKPDDETGASVLCPPEWFNPISETLRPHRNYFKIGQKVEAIDQRSFNGKTCPATIVEVTKLTSGTVIHCAKDKVRIDFVYVRDAAKKRMRPLPGIPADTESTLQATILMDAGFRSTCSLYSINILATQIQIHFDGWNNGYDIKEPYYTRFVMPVGWSQRNGVEISPPKTGGKSTRSAPATVAKQQADQKPRHRSAIVKSAHRSSVVSHHHPSSSKQIIQRLSDMGVNPLQSIRRGGRRPKRPSSSKSGTSTPPPKKGTSAQGPITPAEAVLVAQTLGAACTVTPDAAERIRLAVQRTAENSVEDKVKDLLMHAKVEQQKLAKQLSQPPMAYFSPKTVRGPPPLPASRPESSRSNMQYVPVKNEAEEVVSSTTASVDTPHSTALRPLVARPSSSQTNRDLAKVVGQIRPKVNRDERADSGSPASSSGSFPPTSSATSVTANQQRSHDVLLLSKDEIPLKDRLMTIFVNYSCRIGPHLDPEMVAGIRRKFGPFATHHALREAVQQLLNCSKDDAVTLNLVQPAAVTQILSVTAHCGGTPRSRFIPCVKSSADAWNYLKQLLRKMKVCENFYSSTGEACTICVPSNDVSVEQIVAFSPPIKQWSIEKVATELRKLLDETIVSKFVEQQIDGRSLGLLTTELLMNYMGLALGPALKVIDFVDSVRQAQERQRSSAVEVPGS